MSDHEVDHLLFFVLLVDDSFVLFQLQGLLTTELHQDGLAAFADKLVDDVPIQIAVVEGEEEGAGDGPLQSFDVQLPNLLHFETDIARYVIECPVGFLLH